MFFMVVRDDLKSINPYILHLATNKHIKNCLAHAQGIEGLAARNNDFTFIAKVKANKEKGYQLLDQARAKDGVPANVKFWEFFRGTLKFSPELKHLINGVADI